MSTDREYTLPDAYPPGLIPWDGRFLKTDVAADVVVLELSPSGRTARETAFAFGLDGDFRVLGARERVLISPKRGRWTGEAIPFVACPWVSLRVFRAAMERHRSQVQRMVQESREASR